MRPKDAHEIQTNRLVLGLKLLAMKPTPIEKYQYLTHLRATNVHLFYRLLAENVKVSQWAPPSFLPFAELTSV
jgi:hypothetical protein